MITTTQITAVVALEVPAEDSEDLWLSLGAAAAATACAMLLIYCSQPVVKLFYLITLL